MKAFGINKDYSIKKISKTLLKDIIASLKSVDTYGSVEIYVHDGTVTQITTRSIRKTKSTNGKYHKK